jgi:phospholipase/lecithinase/hemolysin
MGTVVSSDEEIRMAVRVLRKVNMTTTIRFLAAGIFLAALMNGFGQPVITKQPANQTSSLFADAVFRVTSSGDAPVSYQWRFNNADLIGVTNTTLAITNVQRANAGNYRVVVTNLSGSVTSQVATLTITPFNSTYFFGFSWTDTGGNGCDWPPPKYYGNRACNGPMWPEFLSTNLGMAYVKANNYAHCGASTADELGQVTALFRAPAHPELSLYCLWLGGSDFLKGYPPSGLNGTYVPLTNVAAWNLLVQGMIKNNSNAVQRLYAKGARAILFQNQNATNNLDIDALGTNSAVLLESYLEQLNSGFAAAMDSYARTYPGVRLYTVDMFTKFNEFFEDPAAYGFTKTTVSALSDTNLIDKSFTGPGADYYLWDDFHATSKFHKLMASWHLETLTNYVLETLEASITGGSPNIQMNHLQIGRDYTLQKSTDLQTWTDVQSLTASAGTNQWSNPFGNDSTAYFRLKWEH